MKMIRRQTTTRASIGGSEHNEQVAVINWARSNTYKAPVLRWLHAIPNGGKLQFRYNSAGKRYSPEAMKLLDEGMLPGVSDLFLPAARKGFHGLYIEMKYGRNTLSDEQERFLEAVNGEVYLGMACWGADEAIEAISAYLEIINKTSD